jgi:hypothetical protein
LLGDCQTSYTIHKLPKYRSQELEEELKKEEEKLYQQHHERSRGEESCQGKKYYKISKTKNLDNCLKRPFYQRAVGVEVRCDGSKASCNDQFTVSFSKPAQISLIRTFNKHLPFIISFLRKVN